MDDEAGLLARAARCSFGGRMDAKGGDGGAFPDQTTSPGEPRQEPFPLDPIAP